NERLFAVYIFYRKYQKYRKAGDVHKQMPLSVSARCRKGRVAYGKLKPNENLPPFLVFYADKYGRRRKPGKEYKPEIARYKLQIVKNTEAYFAAAVGGKK